MVLAASSLWPQDQQSPAMDGYVTRVAATSDFDVNGFRVLCGSQTLLGPVPRTGQVVQVRGCPHNLPFVGQPMEVSGEKDRKKRTITAARIVALPLSDDEISGSAVIDAVPVLQSANPQPSALLVRADGYQILISKETRIEWTPPLGALNQVKAGDWMKYKGKIDANGVLVAGSVKLSPGAVSKAEHRFREKYEFDPSAGFPSPAPKPLNEWYGNTDLATIPIVVHSPLQQRIKAIGDKLIPAYERDLPGNDPARLNFHFQLVDEPWRGCLVLPSGVIFVPVAAVERMQNDSQIAAVLAAALADVLERQQYRTSRFGAPSAIQAGANFAAAYLPQGGEIWGAGLVASKIVQKDINTRLADQRGRVSLTLMHDAGYDIDQAPLAWWLLDSKKPRPIEKTVLPKYSAYLYQVLGEVWHTRSETIPQGR